MKVIIEPIITEKTTREKENGKLFFKVKKNANKVQIRQEIEQLFGVRVVNVNTMNIKGKSRRYGKSTGVSSDWKKAIVQLQDGQKIQEYENLF